MQHAEPLDSAHLLDIAGPKAPAARGLIEQLTAALKPQVGWVATQPTHFATQTFYALLAKLLAVSVVAQVKHASLLESHAVESPLARTRMLLEQVELGELLAQWGIARPAMADPYAWYLEAWNEPLAAALGTFIEQLTALEFSYHSLSDTRHDDLLKAVYHRLFPREVRHAAGEYYTPHWLAEYLLEQLHYPESPCDRLLDPACGSGTFLLEAIHRLRMRCTAEGFSPEQTLDAVLAQVVGIDLDPLAVLAARTNYLLAIADLLPSASDPSSSTPIELPVYQGDSILEPPPHLGRFECIAGNPPWVGWETLTPDYRAKSRPLWEHYGLFASSGMATILGGGKKDLSLLMSYAVTDHYLREGGRLGFVITQSAFKTLGAGQGFRRFGWGTGANAVSLQVERVDDLTDFQPFEIAGTRTALFIWRKGFPTQYPVPYCMWQKTTRGRAIAASATLTEAYEQTRRLNHEAQPIQPSDPTTAWLTAAPGDAALLEPLWGGSTYRAHEGANTGGANGVYWLEVLREAGLGRCLVRNIIAGAKKQVPQVEVEVEAELLFPLLRGREVRRWQAEPQAMLLMVQHPEQRRGWEESAFAVDFPLAYAYLKRFEPMLRQRAAFRRYFTRPGTDQPRDTGPFYSMFNISTATFAPWKVVWHRMVAPVGAAVVGSWQGRPILPQETHAFVACEEEQEAFYLAGLMNSTPFNYAALCCSQAGGKSFGSPQLLVNLHLPQFEADNKVHVAVAELAKLRQASSEPVQTVGGKRHFATADPELDAAAAAVWGLSTSAAAKLARGMAELTKADLTP